MLEEDEGVGGDTSSGDNAPPMGRDERRLLELKSPGDDSRSPLSPQGAGFSARGAGSAAL